LIISKKSQLEIAETVSEGDLALINTFSKKQLKSEDVFTFSVLLCDNDVDRDGESFSDGAIYALSEMFCGKTGIFDHDWSAKGQVARIYKTEVLCDSTRKGEGNRRYLFLKAYAYMMKTSANESLIADIEGGIKKEVSIGCSVKERLCSICSESLGTCNHIKGEMYAGKKCCGILNEPTDAYEWSFVAVPAQRQAGVMKKYGDMETNTDIFTSTDKKYIELGKKYMKSLLDETVKSAIAADLGFKKDFLYKTFSGLEETDLLQYKATFDEKLAEKYPVVFQITKKENCEKKFSDKEFII